MRFEKVWTEQCRATKAIRRRFGAKSALDYLIGEKLMMFADAIDHRHLLEGLGYSSCHSFWAESPSGAAIDFLR